MSLNAEAVNRMLTHVAHLKLFTALEEGLQQKHNAVIHRLLNTFNRAVNCENFCLVVGWKLSYSK